MKLSIDFRQTKEYARFMSQNGWLAINIRSLGSPPQFIFLKKIAFTPLSIIFASRIPSPLPLDEIEQIGKQYNSAIIRIEPYILRSNTSQSEMSLLRYGYLSLPSGNAPTKTRVLNIGKYSTRWLLNHMRDDTKRNIRQATKRGIELQIIRGDNIHFHHPELSEFHQILSQTQRRSGIPILPKKWLYDFLKTTGRNSVTLYAAYQREIIGGGVFTISGNTMFNTHTCSTRLGKTFDVPSLIVWKAINYGKTASLKYFDFEGVYDERLSDFTKSWQGFTTFKEGFGGKNIYFSLTYEKQVSFSSPRYLNWCRQTLLPHFMPNILPSIYPVVF